MAKSIYPGGETMVVFHFYHLETKGKTIF